MAQNGQMMAGSVKAWIEERGMGFISPESGGEDVFVHRSNLLDGDTLEIGAYVTFVDSWDEAKNKRIATSVSGAVGGGGKGGAKGVGKPSAPARAALPPSFAGGPAVPSDNVWIGDLPADMSKEHLREIFNAYGNVVECRTIPPKQPGQNACGLVRFASVSEASWVVQNLNGNIAQGLDTPIAVKFASTGSGSGGKGGAAPGHLQGTVKAWMEERGMGFISPDAGGEDVFVHRSALLEGQSLSIGARVSFQDDWDFQKNKRIARGVCGVDTGGKGGKGGPAGGPGAAGGLSSDNCWIGDLPHGTDQARLHSIFEAYGSVAECRVLPPKVPGQKTCGLVRFATAEEAQWVADNLNGNIPQGLDTPIAVRFATKPGAKDGASGGWQPPPPTTPHPSIRSSPYGLAGPVGGRGAVGSPLGAKGAGKGNRGSVRSLLEGLKGAGVLGSGKAPEQCQLYVKNLPLDTTDLDLYKLFAPFGAIPSNGVKAMENPDGSCKGFGFVDFVDAECAQMALNSLNGFSCADGSTIAVSLKRQGGGKGSAE